VLAALEALKAELDVAAQFRQQREGYRNQAARLLFSVEGHLESLHAEMAELEKEKDFSVKTKRNAISRRDDHRRFQIHYERRRRLLAIDEAKRVLAIAVATLPPLQTSSTCAAPALVN